jgi:hypothetical protein
MDVWYVVLALVILVVFDILAIRYGADSRHSDDSRGNW